MNKNQLQLALDWYCEQDAIIEGTDYDSINWNGKDVISLEDLQTKYEDKKRINIYWQEFLNKRDELLKESDWVSNRSFDTGEAMPEEWSTYRQALRDITDSQDPLVSDIVWPTKP